MAKFRCIIADDEPLVREGIASFINKNFPDISIEGCFEDGAQALDFIKSGKKIDFAVLDIKMITVSGLEVSQFIFDNRLPIKVIVITGYREFDYAITAMNQHVEGILLKPISFEKLQSALENIVNSLNDDRNIIIKQKKFLVEREKTRKLLKKVLKIPYDELSSFEKQRFDGLNEKFSGFVVDVELQSNPKKWEEIQHHYFGELLCELPDVYFLENFSNVMRLIGLIPKELNSQRELIDDYISRLTADMVSKDIFIRCNIKTYSSLRLIFNENTKEIDVNQNRLNSILNYIADNYSNDMSLEDISRRFYMSKEYFSRFFKKYNGESFVSYLAHVRIEKAKQLIMEGYALHKVSEKVGYKSYKNFSKRFKDIEGITPNEYRQQRR